MSFSLPQMFNLNPQAWAEASVAILMIFFGVYGWYRGRLMAPSNLDGRMWILHRAHQGWMRHLAMPWPPRSIWCGALVCAGLVVLREYIEIWFDGSGRDFLLQGTGWFQGHLLIMTTQTKIILGVGALVLAVITVSLWPSKNIFDSPGGELGAARFSDPLKTTEWGGLSKGSGIDRAAPNPVLAYLPVVAPRSKNARLGLVGARFEEWTLIPLRAQQLNQGILVVGMPGSGKTTRVFNPILLTAVVPVIYSDPKASLPLKDQRPRARVWGLDLRGYRSRSEVWNPLEEIHSKEDEDLLYALILPDLPGNKDPWVRSGARDLLAGFLEIRKAKGWASMSDLADWALSNSPEIWAQVLGPTYEYSAKDPKKFGALSDELKTCLKAWSKPRIRAITSGPSTVRLEDFIKDGGYVLAADKEENKGPIKVFWALLLDRLKSRPERSSQIILAMDEFGDAGAVPDMPNTLAMVRSRGVSIVAGIQSFSLLQRTYREDGDAVRDGFGLRFLYLENFPDDDRISLSKWVGSRTLQYKREKGVPPAQPFAVPLLPVDRIGAWGDAGALLARGNNWTWWHPVQIVLPDSPRGVMPDGEDDEMDQGGARPGNSPVYSEERYTSEEPPHTDRFGF